MHISVKIFHLYGIKRGSFSYNRKESVEKTHVYGLIILKWILKIYIVCEGVDWGKLRA
jgi:hypothetical protein